MLFRSGYFASSSITFGSYTLTNAGAGTFDLFLAKYNADGDAMWATSAGGMADDWGTSVALDVLGNAYLTGKFTSSSIAFNPFTLSNTGVQYTGDLFLSKIEGGNYLGTNETDNIFHNLMYPNPAIDKIFIRTSGIISKGSLTLFDLSDKQLVQQ